jgi:hypothetical protein
MFIAALFAKAKTGDILCTKYTMEYHLAIKEMNH